VSESFAESCEDSLEILQGKVGVVLYSKGRKSVDGNFRQLLDKEVDFIDVFTEDLCQQKRIIQREKVWNSYWLHYADPYCTFVDEVCRLKQSLMTHSELKFPKNCKTRRPTKDLETALSFNRNKIGIDTRKTKTCWAQLLPKLSQHAIKLTTIPTVLLPHWHTKKTSKQSRNNYSSSPELF
jgi:hypothetical protein